VSASVGFDVVAHMLKDCAPGFSWRMATHSRVIVFGALTYRALPKFTDIELGHIRKMIRFLGIAFSCARKHIPNL
jgi:hypothetical protein